LANPNRLSVPIVLEEGEMSVGPLSVKIQLSQSALSQHLAKLRAAGLVKTRREGQVVFYSCTSEAVRLILENLRTFFADRDVVDRKPDR
jgi:DNA-binding transcriptional ArsR family regulator